MCKGLGSQIFWMCLSFLQNPHKIELLTKWYFLVSIGGMYFLVFTILIRIVGPAPELYQFLLYFYDTFLDNFLVLGAALT